MYEFAVKTEGLGKMYKLYNKPSDKIINALGLGKFIFWRKNLYQEFWALRDINLTINKGERIGIIGRNGAGKSTLLKIIIGAVNPSEGRVRIEGNIQALMELGTGFHPEFTGRENIRASLAYQGLNSAKIKNMEEEIIDFSELEDFIDQPVKTYSAGMYARLAFSTATAIDPEVLIIDEILGAGDAYFAGKSVEKMRKLTEEIGATVLFVSHDLASVQALCDRVIWIDRGRIRLDGDPLSVIKQYSASARMEEEIRLRARDYKISKKQAVVLMGDQDIYNNMLFRLTATNGGHPCQEHKIRRITLSADDGEIGRIDVGGPMDNDPQKMHYIIDGHGLMDWGKAEKDSKGYYRFYANYNGRYKHAPFQFAVPKSYFNKKKKLYLDVAGEMKNNEVVLEAFTPGMKDYQPIELVSEQSNKIQYVLDTMMFISSDQEKEYTDANIENHEGIEIDNVIATKQIDEYGSRQAVLSSVQLFGGDGKETKILVSQEPFKVCLNYFTSIPVNNPVFVFCIYLPSGVCASQWIVSGHELGVDIIEGKGQVVFQSKSLLLGRGAYVASAAFFKHYSFDGLEPEAFHVLDRCIHFQIRQRDETDRTDYGICRQPLEVNIYAE